MVETVREFFEQLEHLVVLGGCGGVLAMVVLLGTSHAGRLFMEGALLLLRHGTNEWRSWVQLLNRLKTELATRREDK
jgi:hypothetical protein